MKRKGVEGKKKNRNVRIRTKINIIFLGLIASVAFVLLFFGIMTKSFMKEQAEVLANVEKINFIKSEMVAQPERLKKLCTEGADINASGEEEKVYAIEKYVKQIGENIGEDELYKESRTQLVSIRNLTNKYVEQYEKLKEVCGGESFSIVGYGAVYEMKAAGGFSGDYCNSLITMELDRSSVIRENIDRKWDALIMGSIIISFLSVLFGTAAVLALTKSITKSIEILERNLKVIAAGDLTQSDISIVSRDEIGNLSDVFNGMSRNLKSIISEVCNISRRIGESTQIVNGRIAENASGSVEIESLIGEVSDHIKEQSIETGNAMKKLYEVNSNAQRIMENTNRISEKSKDAFLYARDGEYDIISCVEQIEQVSVVMCSVSEVSSKLEKSVVEMNMILETIAEVSKQTNLLSFNASIEAARAGKAGQGFSVVADKIRTLAEDTKQATEKIADIVTEVQTDVENMAGRVEEGTFLIEEGSRLAVKSRKDFESIKQSTAVVNEEIMETKQQIEETFELIDNMTKSMKYIERQTESNADSISGIVSTISKQSANLKDVSDTTVMLEAQMEEMNRLVSGFRITL